MSGKKVTEIVTYKYIIQNKNLWNHKTIKITILK